MSGLPSYDEALAAALAVVSLIECSEEVPLEQASARVLAADIVADRDLPPFNRAQMDGYALRAAELARASTFPVVQTVAAGMAADIDVPEGACVAIATGAPVPDGLDAVVQHELSDRNNPVRFSDQSITVGHAIHPRGADARKGDVLLPADTVLNAHHLGIAASVGYEVMRVRVRPKAALLTSGDEIRSAGEHVAAHQVRNSNLPMIRNLLQRMGTHPVTAVHLPDDPVATSDAVARALAEADLLVTVGGVSAGERDYFPAALEQAGVQFALQQAAIQPGKPIRVGRTSAGRIVVCLPGNPVSALACCCLFIWPIAMKILGVNAPLPWRTVRLREAVKPNPKRQAFRPCVLHEDQTVTVPKWAGSGDLCHTSITQGFVALPVQSDEVERETELRFLPWP